MRIQKIEEVAEETRKDLLKHRAHAQGRTKTSLGQMTNDLQASGNSDNYTKIELEKWIKQLQQFRMMLEKSLTIEIFHDDDDQAQPILRFIQLKENQTSCKYS